MSDLHWNPQVGNAVFCLLFFLYTSSWILVAMLRTVNSVTQLTPEQNFINLLLLIAILIFQVKWCLFWGYGAYMASSISSMLLSGLLASYHCLHTILRAHIRKEISVAYIRLGHCWNSIHHTLLPILHLCTPPLFLPLHSFHQQEQHHQWCRKLVLKWEWW